MATDMDLARGTRQEKRQSDWKKTQRENDGPKRRYKKNYTKEATVVVDLAEVQEGKAEDIIQALKDKLDVTKILAVRPKMMKEYEITLEKEEDIENLNEGLMIKGKLCEIKKLNNREFVVSFMHLPAYLDDAEILQKLEGWGVTPVSQIRRRLYTGTNIEDGTRFLKVQFPKEVVSLPYSTRIETEDGPQYYRVIHSRQVRTCRLCMSPDHLMKDCPDFKCFKCEETGHFARDCKVVRCPDCKCVLDKCECWYGDQQNGEERGSGQMHETDNEEEQREDTGAMQREDDESTDNDNEIEKTELTQDIVEMEVQMELKEVRQAETEEPEEKERTGEKDRKDKDNENMGGDGTAGTSNKRRRKVKVIPNLEKAKNKMWKQSNEVKQDCGKIAKEGEEME